MEESYLALVAIGEDRTGLVAKISRFIAQREGNVEDSRMAVLGGEFGVMILVSGSKENLAALKEDLSLLSAETGLEIIARSTSSPESHRGSTVAPYVITASALDHEGIVHAVSDALYQTGINIVSLHTTAYNAPITGSPLFRLEIAADIPRDVSISRVRQMLEAVAEEEGLDIAVRSLMA
jgi:glycine cleavage system transcriptional repressor